MEKGERVFKTTLMYYNKYQTIGYQRKEAEIYPKQHAREFPSRSRAKKFLRDNPVSHLVKIDSVGRPNTVEQGE